MLSILLMQNRILTKIHSNLQNQEDQEDSEDQIQVLWGTFGCNDVEKEMKKREERRRCHGQTHSFCVSDLAWPKWASFTTVLAKE